MAIVIKASRSKSTRLAHRSQIRLIRERCPISSSNPCTQIRQEQLALPFFYVNKSEVKYASFAWGQLTALLLVLLQDDSVS